MKVVFRAPIAVTRVHVNQKDQSQGGGYVNTWGDVTNIPNLISYAGSYMDSAGQMISKTQQPEEQDFADFN